MSKRRWTTRRWLIVATVYATLLLASHALTGRPTPAPVPGGAAAVDLPPFDAAGRAAGDPVRLAFRQYPPRSTLDPSRRPVVLLHGSPGSMSNFDLLAPAIAQQGRAVIVPDLPGFGASAIDIPDYSIRAHARYTLALLKHLDIDRAHIVGWSMGGGVALSMADLEPGRIASITMLGSIGVQETEGSGSYRFERAKYLIGQALLVLLPDAIPHFGLLGTRVERQPFIRNFLDTDQRPMRAIMAQLDTPTLILHGRHDPLVADWAAETHHAIIPTSRLIMTPHSHFLPFSHPQETAEWLAPFLARHDTPGVAPLTDTIDLAPRPDRGLYDAFINAPRRVPWWISVPIIAVLARRRPDAATALAGLFVGAVRLDFGVATLGLWIGALARRRTLFDRRSRLTHSLGWLLWVPTALLIAQLAAMADPYRFGGWLGVIGWLVLLSLMLRTLRGILTRNGRRRIASDVRRIGHHEWWPAWLLYLPLIPWIVWLSIQHRGLLVWTAANPGIENGGGIVGERKSAILRAMQHSPEVLPAALIPADTPPHERTARARATIESRPELNGFPIIAKPDTGERGVGVRLVRTPAELDHAVRTEPGDLLLQRYHAGPEECGIFWIRGQRADAKQRAGNDQAGFIFAITRKTFPIITGDGKRTIREHILRDPRLRCQARVFGARFRARLEEVVPAGEHLRLTNAGNHAQGCLFTDGSDLMTPELERAIDGIASAFAGGGLDFGRFDLRYEADEALRAGRGFAVIEVNGTTSEATNIYDPGRPALWAYRVLFAQWRLLYERGAERRAGGHKPLTVRALFGLLIGNLRRPDRLAD